MKIKIKSNKGIKTVTVHNITEHKGIKYAQRVEYPIIKTFVKYPKTTWKEINHGKHNLT